MSFKRGQNKSSFGNHRFNLNAGTTNTGVNPWEGGMMPGRGILPTPNNNFALTSSQAQLAIASNLISNLLRSQQDTQPPQVPSLLSLGNNFGSPSPNFQAQQPFGPMRFNDRAIRRPLKNRRFEPYKMGPRARNGPGNRRGPSVQQSRTAQSGLQRNNGNQIQQRNVKSSKAIAASNRNQTASGRKEEQDIQASNNENAVTADVNSEEVEETEDKKRDWKDEKKEVETSQTDKPASEADISKTESGTSPEKTSPVKSDGNNTGSPVVGNAKDGKAANKKSEVRHAESRYAEIPMNRMSCHVCNKNMWDGFSFENHLRGRAHQLMMDKLDESYKMKVDLMRHDLRVAEEQREFSLNNSKRRGKKVSVDLNVREYCTMCDLNFYGPLSLHRKSEKHQQLKTFLHPRCLECAKEFPSRIEYDEHCLTPAHMKSVIQSEVQRKNKKKGKLAKGESEVRTAEDEEQELVDSEPVEKDDEFVESTEFLIDIVDDLSDPKYQIPTYKHCRRNQIEIGKAMVKEVTGYYCEKCRRFMLTPEDLTAHLRGIVHYRNFVEKVKAQIGKANDAVEKTTATVEKSDENVEKDNEEYEGNWKRRKVTHSEDEESMQTAQAEEKTDEDDTLKTEKTGQGSEKYDPLEADAQSENENSHSEEEIPDEKMWADMDNDNDMEIGNLLEDDISEDKQQMSDSKVIETPQKPVVAELKSILKKPSSNLTSPLDPTQTSDPNTTENSNPNTTENSNPNATPNSNANATPNSNANATPNSNANATPNSNANATPNSNANSTENSNPNKTPNATPNTTPNSTRNANQNSGGRGRGHYRARGNRARRSRR